MDNHVVYGVIVRGPWRKIPECECNYYWYCRWCSLVASPNAHFFLADEYFRVLKTSYSHGCVIALCLAAAMSDISWLFMSTHVSFLHCVSSLVSSLVFSSSSCLESCSPVNKVIKLCHLSCLTKSYNTTCFAYPSISQYISIQNNEWYSY